MWGFVSRPHAGATPPHPATPAALRSTLCHPYAVPPLLSTLWLWRSALMSSVPLCCYSAVLCCCAVSFHRADRFTLYHVELQ